MRRVACLALALAAPLPAHAQAQAQAESESEAFSATCGGARFTVEVDHASGHPLDSIYRLYGAPAGEPRTALFTSEDGGWLDAACVRDGQGRERLLFQSSCGGSACAEDRYGLVDPRGRALLLVPGPGNAGNSRAAAAALGLPKAPWLPNGADAFCCRPRR